MAIQITPLLALDTEDLPRSTSLLVDLIRHNVPATAATAEQAEQVLVRLGASPTQARSRLRLCGVAW